MNSIDSEANKNQNQHSILANTFYDRIIKATMIRISIGQFIIYMGTLH